MSQIYNNENSGYLSGYSPAFTIMTIKYLKVTVLIALCALFVSCGNKEKHGISGNIKGASDNSYVVLEATNDFGLWYPLDSAKIGDNGDFFIPFDSPASPQLYRVRYEGKYVYLPLDSTENLTLKSSAKAFDSDFVLSGSPLADNLTRFEREARHVEAINNSDSTDAFRRHVYATYLEPGKGDMLSFYILTRHIGDAPLIDYTDPLFWAVANNFMTYRPDDPHTATLVELAKSGQAMRRKAKGYQAVMEAPEIALLEIELPDKSGVIRRLSDVVGKGKPTVLAMTSFSSEENAALNRALRTIYETGQAQIFEVVFDTDRLIIENGAKDLPWTVVVDPDGFNSSQLINYNVSSLPTMFIYDSRGELSQRASSTEELHKLLSATK